MITRSRRLRALLFLVVPAFGGACDADRERLAVTICGDLRLGADVDAIRVTVLDEDRTLAYSGLDELVPTTDAGAADAGTADAGADLDPACASGPFLDETLHLPPGAGTAWVEVQTLRDGLETARAQVRASGSAVIVGLTQECLGVSCPLGQTCQRGECTLLPVDGDPSDCEATCAP